MNLRLTQVQQEFTVNHILHTRTLRRFAFVHLGFTAAAVLAAIGCSAPTMADEDFQPIIEAELPTGIDGTPFPSVGPLDQVVFKTYSAHRVARAGDIKNSGNGFWRLFNHIQKNDVAMTAPVEMNYDDENHRRGDEWMGFYYEHANQGQAGEDGSVTVVDIPEKHYLSLGLRGPITQDKLQAAQEQLQAALADPSLVVATMPAPDNTFSSGAEAKTDNTPAQDEAAHAHWIADGDMRLLGYNSPFVRRTNQFYEMQIPVSAVKDPRASAPNTADE